MYFLVLVRYNIIWGVAILTVPYLHCQSVLKDTSYVSEVINSLYMAFVINFHLFSYSHSDSPWNSIQYLLILKLEIPFKLILTFIFIIKLSFRLTIKLISTFMAIHMLTFLLIQTFTLIQIHFLTHTFTHIGACACMRAHTHPYV